MPTFFLSGAFIGGHADPNPKAPLLSALDAGLQHGVGLFETMLGGVADGRPWILHLDEHLVRLERSARDLGLSSDLRTAPLAEALLETLRRSGLPRARLRLTITGGDLNLLAAARDPAARTTPARLDPTVLAVVQPATAYPPAMLDRGVAVALADTRVNPLDPMAGHKTLNYWWRLRELQAAAARQAAEALVFSVTNHLAGGCVSNAIIVKGDQAWTPIARGEEEAVAKTDPDHDAAPGATLRSPVLPGVTRAWVMDELASLGLICRPRMLTIADVLEADELVLTNSSWGVLPVVRVEAAAISAGQPGPMARDLVARWARAADAAADLARAGDPGPAH